jgi:hypothetical protein
LEAEVLYLARRFGPVRYDDQDATWLLIETFPIPTGWNKRQVSILVDVPAGTPGYPQLAPQWFWTDRDLRTSLGQPIAHFFAGAGTGGGTNQEHWQRGWGHFCLHVRSWHPVLATAQRDLRAGDSLLTYLELIAMVFHDRRTLARSYT